VLAPALEAPDARARSWPSDALVAGAGALIFMLAVSHGARTPYDNYVLLADAWKHGRNWVPFPGDYLDVMPFHGRAYVVEAPLPAVLLLPAVFLFGTNANQTLLSNLLGGLAVYAAWRLCEQIGLARVPTAAATAFVFFGTSLFVCSTVGSVWFLGHVAAACFTLLALCECFGARRPWLIAIWALCAAFSRYPLFLALPLYFVLVVAHDRRRPAIESFVLPIVPAFVAWMLYNRNRFGTLLDPAFSMFYRIMDADYRGRPAVFSISYVPAQLQTYFLTPPRLLARPPFVVPWYYGLGLPFTSLPFAYAVFAGIGLDAIVLWSATLVTALPSLAYYGTGDGQYGVRHALDFEPFLFALLLLALQRRPSRIATGALVVFAAFGVYEGLVWLLWPALTQ
jgi:hypothetical protein